MVLVLITIIVCQINNLMKLKKTKTKSTNSDMDTEYNTGLMGLITRANGTTTKQKAKELSIMQKEISIEESSRMTWLMDMENIFILMAANIKVSLKMTYKKDTEKKNGWMEQSMLDPM